nr:OPT/YSL family transporter [Deltaproteobacteria bacterium]
ALVYEPLLPENVLPTMFGLTYATAGAGFAVSLLAVGSGMIVGNRINVSMAAGAIVAWVIGPHILLDQGIIQAPLQAHECGMAPEPSPGRNSILLWMMWPGTGMLVAAGLTALGLKWRTLTRTFSTLSSKSIDVAEFPLKWVGIGVVSMTIALVVIQQAFFDVPFWTTLIATALSVPLMLVGLRVLGETNWGPISQLTNMMQVIFAAIVPRNISANLAASGTTGTIAVQSEAIMQDYKAGHIIGSTPRYLTYAQLLAAPIGAIAVSLSYPAFRDLYGVGGDTGLSAPGSRRIAGFSEVLAEGFDKLPPGAPQFLLIGALLGIAITLLEIKWKKWIPSATGLGIGMMVPGNVVLTMVLGGIALSMWKRVNKPQADKLGMPLASGLIAGEALAAILVPLIVAIGLLSASPDPVHAGCGMFGDAMQLIPGCRR